MNSSPRAPQRERKGGPHLGGLDIRLDAAALRGADDRVGRPATDSDAQRLRSLQQRSVGALSGVDGGGGGVGEGPGAAGFAGVLVVVGAAAAVAFLKMRRQRSQCVVHPSMREGKTIKQV